MVAAILGTRSRAIARFIPCMARSRWTTTRSPRRFREQLGFPSKYDRVDIEEFKEGLASLGLSSHVI